MHYQRTLFHHVAAAHSCARGLGARALINLENFQLEVRARNRYYQFVAQFLYLRQNRLQFSGQLRSDSKGFAGWLPYFNKLWRLATDKLAFKEFCAAAGLDTPRFWNAPAAAARGVIIKQRRSSFGYGIRGPFKTLDGADPQCRLRENEFYEEFVAGRVAKAWYWNDKLVCLEMRAMPMVSGDGLRSLLQLIVDEVAPPQPPPSRAEIEALARYQGISADDVIPAGTAVVGDFRYGSPLYPMILENLNVLAKHENAAIGRQFAHAGPVFWHAIPEEIRPATLYTVDAIVDGDDRVRFLEMNCNPTVHPDVYLPMFETLFGAIPPEDQAVPAGVRPTFAPPPQRAIWTGFSGSPDPALQPASLPRIAEGEVTSA